MITFRVNEIEGWTLNSNNVKPYWCNSISCIWCNVVNIINKSRWSTLNQCWINIDSCLGCVPREIAFSNAASAARYWQILQINIDKCASCIWSWRWWYTSNLVYHNELEGLLRRGKVFTIVWYFNIKCIVRINGCRCS